MKIIISPAKQMVDDTDYLPPESMPIFNNEASKIINTMFKMPLADLKNLWNCNDSIAQKSYDQLCTHFSNVLKTPAILSYNGIAYKYMGPSVMEREQFEYVKSHLLILSGMHGILKPMDAILPYRLEMQTKLQIDDHKDLYSFWGKKIYDNIFDESRIVINLASKEYSKCIEKYISEKDTFITCIFGEYINGNIVQKGVYAKMARGEAVRYMAENAIEYPEELKNFDRLGYSFAKKYSNSNIYTFIKEQPHLS